MYAGCPAGTNIEIYFNKRTGTQRILIGKVRNNSAANGATGVKDYPLPAKRQSHRPTPGGDRVGSAATGHTDSVRLAAFVYFLRHNPYAVANGVLQELSPDTDRKASAATTDALHKSGWMTIPYTE